MEQCKIVLVLLVLWGICAGSPTTGPNKNEGPRAEFLDRNGRYHVQWKADVDTKTIVFEVTVQTVGFVGFGISPVGGMTGADIVIGGISDGVPYFTDRHGVGNQEPIVDDQQDWTLLEASENATHTQLKFSRLWVTCDPQDVAITEDTNNFIWAFGDSDFITYHTVNRGTHAVNILDPAMPPFDTSNFLLWNMTSTMTMPSKKTTYWCTVQKNPPMSSQHHIVGFRPVLDTDEALRHTHHFIVHKCVPPEGSSAEETFEHMVGTPGGECYRNPEIPINYCRSYLFVWAVGGKTVIYPDHVGYPVPESGTTDYYLLEVHYDNPNELQGVTFETGLQLFYTPILRQFDAGTITAGHETRWTITIPPQSQNYNIIGHCSPSCTSNIPPAGIHVFNILLHSHLAGRKLKLRHFRNGVELPWAASDDNYNFDYQQNRPLREELTILPGDQLTYECTYDSTWANGSIIGGMSTEEEMCNTFLWYYPKISLDVCGSEFPPATLMNALGIERMTGGDDPVVLAPPNLAGKTYTEVLNTMIPWTPANRERIQRELRYSGHDDKCRLLGFATVAEAGSEKDAGINAVFYPEITEEWAPIDQCNLQQ